jgi:hypothetical protein
MAEPERTTSFAKSVEGLHHEDSALDRARALRDQFQHAQQQHVEKPREAERPQGETGKSGSQMVRQDAPVMRPTPNGMIRQMVDRQSASSRLSKEGNAEQKKIAAAKMAQQFKSKQGKSHDHDRER